MTQSSNWKDRDFEFGLHFPRGTAFTTDNERPLPDNVALGTHCQVLTAGPAEPWIFYDVFSSPLSSSFNRAGAGFVEVALMMDAVHTSDMSVWFHARRYIPESCHLHTRRRENLKSLS
jgi:hypothetical protein